MKPERVLLPINIRKCPLEVFSFVNGLASRAETTFILLHVVNLNIMAPDNRVYEELGREARSFLNLLADKYIDPIASTVVRVRFGNPAEETLAEATEQNVDLIILPTYGPSFWTRLRSLWKSASAPIVCPMAEKVIRGAACGVFVAVAETRFDCEKAWGCPRPAIAWARDGAQFAR